MKITKFEDSMFRVHWDNYVHCFINRLDLYNILFNKMRCASDIGLLLDVRGIRRVCPAEFTNDNLDEVTWISENLTHYIHYKNYLQEMYDIFAVYFTNEKEAILFASLLEKEYIWHQMKE